jgi:CysZ protein
MTPPHAKRQSDPPNHLKQSGRDANRSPAQGLGGFLQGTIYPLRALRLFRQQPQLRQYVLLPIALNLLVGITLYAGLLFTGLRAIDALISEIPVWIANAPHLSAPHLSAPHLSAPQLPLSTPQLPPAAVPHVAIDWSTWTKLISDWQVALPSWWPQLPHWALPHIALPQINLPQINWPQINWPQINWPQINWPQIPLPQITLPNWLTELPEFGLGLVLGLVRLLLVVILLLLTGFILLQFGVLLGAPWYGKLSEELEQLQMGQLQTIALNPVQEISRALLYELKKLTLTVGVGLPLLICNFFPGPGTLVATVGGIGLAATLVCLDFLDAAVERRRPRFRRKLGLIRQTLPASAGFALVCLGLVSIPLINLLAIPVCVAGGTLFACERILPLLGAVTEPALTRSEEPPVC